MKRMTFHSTVFAFGLTLMFVLPVAAQQAGENINVLPVVPQNVPDWEIKGDGYLQRQVEPTIAASTRNPDHLLAFFNDYRAVDVPDDQYVGEEQFQVALMALNVAEFMMAGIIPEHGIALPDLPPIAAAEAWVGMSRSYDGGLTWAGGFLPGADFDNSAASLASPVYGLEAATDPVLAPAPCGYFYLVFVAFTRGGESKLAVARYQDLNNDEGGDTIEYLGTTVIETGNNADNGHFLDKPDIEVDVWRGEGGPEQCGHRVYVSYSTFVGLDKYEKFQSKVNFAKSEDFGLTFSIEKINKTWNQNQGSAIAIDPGVGEPGKTGGPGTIYVAWRHFFNPDAIIIRKSVNYGSSWANPVEVNDSALIPFDQPTITTAAGLASELAFRSNGFPTATVTDQGKVFVAWQERISPNGSPRIMLSASDNDGKDWSPQMPVDDSQGIDKPYNAGAGGQWKTFDRGPQVMPKLSFGGGRLMLAYYESRGLIAQDSNAKDVVLPTDVQWSNAAQNKYITDYHRVLDFRAALLDPENETLLGSSTSIQVSRYPISSSANLSIQELEDVAYVAPCNPLDPLGPNNPPCARQVNRVNAPTSAAGSSPFIGDYADLVPMLQFVIEPDPNEPNFGEWRWATKAADVPSQGFHAIFTDNRHIIPPHDYPGSDEWLGYSNYGPPGIGGACTNAGSRNSDVLTSRVTTDVVVNTPTTYKVLGSATRSFPFSVNNRNAEPRFYFLEIDEFSAPASFAPTESITSGYIYVFPYSTVSQVLYADSAAAPDDVFRTGIYEAICNDPELPLEEPNCYVPTTCEDPIEADCRLGTATFNADQSHPETGLVNLGDAESENQNPFVQNPFVQNPFVQNSTTANYSPSNPFVQNPFVQNPFVQNSPPSEEEPVLKNTGDEPTSVYPYDVIDTTWVVTTNDLNNTASAQVPLINVDNAELYKGNYAFQLIVHKASSRAAYRQQSDENGLLYYEVDGDGKPVYDENGDLVTSNAPGESYNPLCEAYQVEQDQILSNVVQDPNAENPFVQNPFVLNPFVQNPFVQNPFVQNPFVLNPFVQNSTFTMAPPDDAVAGYAKSMLKTASLPDGTIKAERAPNEVKITLRAFQLKPFCDPNGQPQITEDCIDPDEELIYDPLIDPPSAAVASLTCVLERLNGDYEDPELPDDPEAAAALCFDTRAPDLVADFDLAEQPTVFEGDVPFNFPANGWTLRNQGYGLAWAENGDLRHGVILSQDEFVGLETDDYLGESVKDVSDWPWPGNLDTNDLRLSWQTSDQNPLAPHNQIITIITDENTILPEDPIARGEQILVTLAPQGDTNQVVATEVTIIDDEPVSGQISGLFEAYVDDGFTMTSFGEEIFDPDLVTIPDWVPAGTYYLFHFVDETSEVSEFNEPNNIQMIEIRKNAAPTVTNGFFSTDEDKPLIESLADLAVDPDNDDLTYEIIVGPVHGTLPEADFDAVTGDFIYLPEADYNGPDSFTFKVNDGYADSGVATVYITVLPTDDYIFDGFFDPWTEIPPYNANAGSSIPLKWGYLDPDNPTMPLPTGHLEPSVIANGPFECGPPDYTGQSTNEIHITGYPYDPGSSGLRYSEDTMQWQINWETDPGGAGCYYVRVYPNDSAYMNEVSPGRLIILND